MPFGEEISRANYKSDSVRQKFTGYERDGETGLDYAKARMFGSGVGRFTSPDDFLNDTHVSNPQSWNLYAYVKNNPLNSTDPLGKKAKLTSKHDKDTNTTTISITASFVIYGAAGQNVSAEDIERYKQFLIKGIAAAYNTSRSINGRTYILKTNIGVTTASNETEAKQSGADNLVELGTVPLVSEGRGGAAVAAVSTREGESFDRMQVAINLDEGLDFSGSFEDRYSRTFAHEFSHVLGMPDSDRQGLFKSCCRGEYGLSMSNEDFKDLFTVRRPSNGNDDQPPPEIGKPYPNYTDFSDGVGASHIFDSTNRTLETRRAISTAIHVWENEVRK